MEFMLDTANLEAIRRYAENLPLAGVTSNPSIIKKEGKIDFFNHMKEIRAILAPTASLHVQVVATDYAGMMRDAEAILKQIDEHVFIKVPVTELGLRVIKELRAQNINVTATAIYSKIQAYLAISADANYIAPYFNRMENVNINPREAISEMSAAIKRANSSTKILGASFKNVSQVNSALECGAHAVTLGADIFSQAFEMPSIDKAVKDFTSDFEAVFGAASTISKFS
ncbi:fructose-6-phosphate aldolase [Listeria fleischmannii]|uniref:Fructose-6-phosphate aldolase n=1 Tax=Listeria fleischmannii TaxID=1069827 RepID=A0A841YD24_9LIST|nr:fructose-6-phosphate aldolase [Listeria fleischmannii]MBC1398078.1 fructose-6-phosphate aldolase [Listeria fleischmannii]MBC1426139.1 fructose-6-phosphate aldolase [Listeria fleischmannii]